MKCNELRKENRDKDRTHHRCFKSGSKEIACHIEEKHQSLQHCPTAWYSVWNHLLSLFYNYAHRTISQEKKLTFHGYLNNNLYNIYFKSFIAEREAEEVDEILMKHLKQRKKSAQGPFCFNITALTLGTLWMKEWFSIGWS